MEDVVRYFVEECDYLEGYHLLADVDSAFGGLASSVVQLLRDDFSPKAPIFCLGLNDSRLSRERNTVSLSSHEMLIASKQ